MNFGNNISDVLLFPVHVDFTVIKTSNTFSEFDVRFSVDSNSWNSFLLNCLLLNVRFCCPWKL